MIIIPQLEIGHLKHEHPNIRTNLLFSENSWSPYFKKLRLLNYFRNDNPKDYPFNRVTIGPMTKLARLKICRGTGVFPYQDICITNKVKTWNDLHISGWMKIVKYILRS